MQVGTDSLRASALAVEGIVVAAEGDLDSARLRMEDAADLFSRAGRRSRRRGRGSTRRAGARALGHKDAAAGQARLAPEALQGMQAEREARRAGALFSELGHDVPGLQ